MKQELQRVRLEDFNTAALRKAAREGRLYIEPAAEYETNVEQEVLTYVSRIAEYTAPPYRECIDEMWRRIVAHPSLAPTLASRKEPFNKYVVTSIAIFLRNQRVYTLGSDVALHLELEGIKERNSYYTARNNYKTDTGALFRIVSELKNGQMEFF